MNKFLKLFYSLRCKLITEAVGILVLQPGEYFVNNHGTTISCIFTRDSTS